MRRTYDVGDHLYSIEEIEETKIISRELDDIFYKFRKYIACPHIIDNDKALVKAYVKAYRKGGQEAARNEVKRLVDCAYEFRKLKEMLKDHPDISIDNM
jgi:hypothetical protein